MTEQLVPSAGWLKDADGKRWYWANGTWYPLAPPRADIPLSPSMPHGSDVEIIDIVGEDEHLTAIQSLFPGGFGEAVFDAVLIPASADHRDPIAVEVAIDDQTVGFLPSEIAPAVHPRVSTAGAVIVPARVLCASRPGGAWARVTLHYVG